MEGIMRCTSSIGSALFGALRKNDLSLARSVAFLASPLRFFSVTANSGVHNERGGCSTVTRDARPIKKLLVANRGEIALRIQRSCRELGIKSVGIYSKDDANSLHRQVFDESFVVGKGLSPLTAYLNSSEIVDLARNHGVDAIHPGYGFLSENADFAKEVEDAGIMFVGPHHGVIRQMGDKVRARHAAESAGVSCIPGTTAPVSDVAEAIYESRRIGFPVMLKAAHGGGGKGMRRVFHENELRNAFERASSEAQSAFGNGELFIEKLVERGQHIEVQILGDHFGNVVHFHERDCTIQRRHQKVIEIAPAPFLDARLRASILADALKIAEYVKYQNAGTVEFLVDKEKYYFIEVNARLQVEHTVSEEITGFDLVKAQLAVREGQSLPDLGIVQERINRSIMIDPVTGGRSPVSIQCRITTEDSQKDFQPSTGRIDQFLPPSGPGIRIDGAVAAPGAIILPFYDSLLLKLIVRGKNFEEAVARACRGLRETKIRGVTTNIPFILNVLNHQKFQQGKTDVRFIDDNPDLLYYDPVDLSSYNICKFLAEVVVNGPQTPLVNAGAVPDKSPAIPPAVPVDIREVNDIPTGAGSWAGPPEDREMQALSGISSSAPRGYKNALDEVGPSEFARMIRKEKQLLVTDTTLRDAHQSLLATRMRTFDMLKVAPSYAYLLPTLFSLELWGGASFDVAYRFLRENPWRRLELLRELIPNIPFQMLLRGVNGVGYTVYPDNVIGKFCEEAVKYGVDIFRIFDSLNYVDNLKMGIDAVGAAGGVVEAAIAYTGDVADPARKPYTLDYYLELARILVESNVHILCIKDMAGLLRPTSSTLLVSALRNEFPKTPIHVHTHDTGGTGVASMLAAVEAGADVVDAAMDSLSGLTSQPSIGAVVSSLQGTPRETFLPRQVLSEFSDYYEKVRRFYAPFECTATLKSVCPDLYKHEIPGGQYTNLHMQAFSLGMGDQWPQIREAYAAANRLLGNPPKVTPSSKVVGDLAQFMVQNGYDEATMMKQAALLSLPSSVIEYLEGKLGQPPFGFFEPFRSKVLRGTNATAGRPGSILPPVNWDLIRCQMESRHGRKFRDAEVVSSVLYPQVFNDYQAFLKEFGDISILPSANFFVGVQPNEELVLNMAGREVRIRYIAKTCVLPDGTRDVVFEVMGIPRTINVRDKYATENVATNTKADPADPKQIAAPMPGTLIELKVKDGDQVNKGDPLAVLSAMKMETVVVATCSGVVSSIAVILGSSIQAGDLLIRLV